MHTSSTCSLLICMLLLSGCGGGDGSSIPEEQPFEFTPVTPTMLEQVASAVAARDLSPQDVSLFHSTTAADHELRIYEHRIDGRRHYGVVSIPSAASESGYPVVLFAFGLDQSNPPVDMARWEQTAQARLDEAVFVVPLFRGQTLVYRGLTATADGDFCDAFDGAADDAIALLNVVEAEVPAADFSRVMARGGSRGGNTALLLGERDPRITYVSAASAPVDFYRASVQQHYADQYRCQFLHGKTTEQARQRMLASSPLHFSMQPGVRHVVIDHGDIDSVVPSWNANEMYERLRAQGVDVELNVYAGFGHSDLQSSPAFRSTQDRIYETFLAP